MNANFAVQKSRSAAPENDFRPTESIEQQGNGNIGAKVSDLATYDSIIDTISSCFDEEHNLMTQIGNETPHDLPQELAGAIRKKAIEEVARYAVLAMVGFLVVAGTGWWLYLKTILPAVTGGIPVNAILATNAPGGCPSLGEGWSDAGYGGRFISVVDSKDEFSLGQHPGHYSITLNPENMPQVYVAYSTIGNGGGDGRNGVVGVGFGKAPQSSVSFGSANPTPIDITPPHVALYLCQKVR